MDPKCNHMIHVKGRQREVRHREEEALNADCHQKLQEAESGFSGASGGRVTLLTPLFFFGPVILTLDYWPPEL